jgi:ubiquinone/menaquinone biosynthesis C-methylase UbiE
MSEKRTRVLKRLFAWFSSHKNTAYEKIVMPRKQALFQSLNGTIVEIGPGAGANFAYFPRGIHYIAVEPNPFMHRYLSKEADRMNFEIDLRGCSAENIDLGEASADAVVGTLVLCSVDDQRQVLREILRILKPGGSYYFIEHVAAPEKSILRIIQRVVRFCWKIVNDGCHPDRETLSVIQTSGFTTVEHISFHVGAPVVSPHIAGRAIK